MFYSPCDDMHLLYNFAFIRHPCGYTRISPISKPSANHYLGKSLLNFCDGNKYVQSKYVLRLYMSMTKITFHNKDIFKMTN